MGKSALRVAWLTCCTFAIWSAVAAADANQPTLEQLKASAALLDTNAMVQLGYRYEKGIGACLTGVVFAAGPRLRPPQPQPSQQAMQMTMIAMNAHHPHPQPPSFTDRRGGRFGLEFGVSIVMASSLRYAADVGRRVAARQPQLEARCRSSGIQTPWATSRRECNACTG